MNGDFFTFFSKCGPVDYAIVGVFAVSIVLGVWRGLIRETASIAAVILGFVAASLFKGNVEPFVAKFTENRFFVEGISFALVYAAAAVAIVFLGRLARKAVRAIRLGWVDYIGGVLFGFLRAFLAVGFLFFMWTLYQPLYRSPFRGSVLAPRILRAFVEATGYFGDDLAEFVEPHLHFPKSEEQPAPGDRKKSRPEGETRAI